jgi:hypothetical protein
MESPITPPSDQTATARRLPLTTGFREGVHRYSAAQFLIALVLLIVSEPFIERMDRGDAVESILLTLVLLSAVLAIGGGRRTLIWAIVLVIPALVGRWAYYGWSERVSPEAGLFPGLVFIVFVVIHLLRFILRAPRVTSEVLYAGIATYLMLGVLWAFAYLLVARLVPDSFAFTAGTASGQSMKGFNGLYFSFVTLSTVGYGDIIPVSPAARLLAIVEATAGMIYMTVLIARLVALYSSGGTRMEEPPAPHEKDSPS